MQTTSMETEHTNDKISVGKMQFEVINEYPENVEHDMKEQIELQLYNIFKKYDKEK